jgi:hypothetical protein
MKPTNWKNVKKGTPVLFRRTKDSEYEAGTWTGSGAVSTLSGAFCWYLDNVSGALCRAVGTYTTYDGEWRIDRFWCKLAKPETKEIVFVVTDKYKRVWHLPLQAVLEDWAQCEADYVGATIKSMFEFIKEGKVKPDIETWMAEQMFADVLASKATLVKDLTDKQKIALAERVMTPDHLDRIVDEHKIKYPSKTAFNKFYKSLVTPKKAKESK